MPVEDKVKEPTIYTSNCFNERIENLVYASIINTSEQSIRSQAVQLLSDILKIVEDVDRREMLYLKMIDRINSISSYPEKVELLDVLENMYEPTKNNEAGY